MADNRRKILDIAIGLMSEKGYHGTSLQMIADGVGITKSSIFHHFKNKEEILVAILEDAFPKALYSLMMVVNDKELTGVEKLKEFIELQMKVVAERGEILRIYLSEGKFLGAQHARLHGEGRRHYTKLVKQIVEQVQEEGDSRFKGMDSTIVANTLLGLCNWSIRWYRKNGKLTLDEICEQLCKLINPY